MSQPNREAELFDASEAFWDGETKQGRQDILLAVGYHGWFVADIAEKPFNGLSKIAQRAVVRQIGEKLAQ